MRGMSSIAGAEARRACSAGLARGGAKRSEAVNPVPKMSAIAIPSDRQTSPSGRGCEQADIRVQGKPGEPGHRNIGRGSAVLEECARPAKPCTAIEFRHRAFGPEAGLNEAEGIISSDEGGRTSLPSYPPVR